MPLKSVAVIAASCVAGSAALSSAAAALAEAPIDPQILTSTGIGGVGVWGVGIAWTAFRRWTKLVDRQIEHMDHEKSEADRAHAFRGDTRRHWDAVERGLALGPRLVPHAADH